jgi:hypothetical protein
VRTGSIHLFALPRLDAPPLWAIKILMVEFAPLLNRYLGVASRTDDDVLAAVASGTKACLPEKLSQLRQGTFDNMVSFSLDTRLCASTADQMAPLLTDDVLTRCLFPLLVPTEGEAVQEKHRNWIQQAKRSQWHVGYRQFLSGQQVAPELMKQPVRVCVCRCVFFFLLSIPNIYS